MPAAIQTLLVTFTPQNLTYYTTATASTTFTVTKATPILDVTASSGSFDGTAFPASATIVGAIEGVDNTPAARLDNIAPTLSYYEGLGTAGISLGSAPPSAPGTYTVVAAFAGDANYQAVVSAPVTFTIGQGAATLALSSTSGSSIYGATVSLIATVGTGGGTPGGTVTFYDGDTPLATVTVHGTGTATLTTSDLSVGFIRSPRRPVAMLISRAYGRLLIPRQSPRPEPRSILVQTSLSKKKKSTSVAHRPIRLTVEVTRPYTGGGVPAGEVTFELLKKSRNKTKVDHAQSSGPGRRRGNVEPQDESGDEEDDHGRLQRRCQRQGEQSHHAQIDMNRHSAMFTISRSPFKHGPAAGLAIAFTDSFRGLHGR